ncbi:RnfH family protein [Ectothiorhodospira mobilis]|uniref:RnfH family protein n=1 Tax=Ectothiorhodospira mobilis TaxID=195064 RepID=UPI001EE833E0|nr:RnfH family protein [Ectothiorhodospira mobilis]MCG5535344.1 RnfH family protein [Ectothiorhodospira mobilis]
MVSAEAGAGLKVEVAYAKPEDQAVLEVTLPLQATVEEAIRASGILERFPEIDLSSNKVGIYGKLTRLDAPLRDRDRVEIYRPLIADPRAARRRRAAGGA